MACAWRCDLLVDWLCAGWPENYNHICRRNSGGICGQVLSTGGILLPLLWSLVVDELIRGLSENGCNTIGYADDIAILICGTFLHTILEHLQEALSMVQHWCNRTQLSINPQKMVIVPFTRKRD